MASQNRIDAALNDGVSEGARVWVRNSGAAAKDRPFLSAIVEDISADGLKATIRPEAGDKYGGEEGGLVQIEANRLLPQHHATPVDDQARLVHISEATILHNTAARARADEPYSWLGPGQMLSVNPCGKELAKLYGEQAMLRHTADGEAERSEPAPHPYALGEAAIGRLHRHRMVAVLVSGESGSGKTEAAKQLVSYLTWRSARGQSASIDTFARKLSA